MLEALHKLEVSGLVQAITIILIEPSKRVRFRDRLVLGTRYIEEKNGENSAFMIVGDWTKVAQEFDASYEFYDEKAIGNMTEYSI